MIFVRFLDNTFRDFFSPCLSREEINATFDSKIFALNKDEPTYEARKKYYERKKAEELDGVDSYEKNKRAKKRKFEDVENKISINLDARKTKRIVNFNDRESANTKSFAVKKKKDQIKVTGRFMKFDLLRFMSLKSFIYSLTELLYFPGPKVKEIYQKC